MKKNTLGLLAALAIASAVPAVAQAAVQLPQGTQEIGLAGNLNLNAPHKYQLNLDGSYGYFIRDNWEIGGNAGVAMNKENKSAQLGGFTEYNFTNSTNWVPFVGASAQFANVNNHGGFAVGSGSADAKHHASAVNFKVTGGVKYFINPNVALTAAVNYNISTKKINVTENGLRDSFTNIVFGTRFYY
jgi:opacity protein-like surface antigen